MPEVFGIASFRSRQQAQAFERLCRRDGARVQLITTPRDVSVGCGLSLRFDMGDYPTVRAVYDRARPSNLIGFYRVMRAPGMRTAVERLA